MDRAGASDVVLVSKMVAGENGVVVVHGLVRGPQLVGHEAAVVGIAALPLVDAAGQEVAKAGAQGRVDGVCAGGQDHRAPAGWRPRLRSTHDRRGRVGGGDEVVPGSSDYGYVGIRAWDRSSARIARRGD